MEEQREEFLPSMANTNNDEIHLCDVTELPSSEEVLSHLNEAQNALLDAIEPLRSSNETEQLMAPIDDILRDIYDLKSSGTNSSPIAGSNFPSFSDYSLAPFNTFGNFNTTSTDMRAHYHNFDTQYFQNSTSNFMNFPPVLVPPTPPVIPNEQGSADEENDSRPVYINFNLNTMPCFPFNSPNNIQHFHKSNGKDNNIRYMEYLNESGEAVKTKFFDNQNAIQNQNIANNLQQTNVNGSNHGSILNNNQNIPQEYCNQFEFPNANQINTASTSDNDKVIKETTYQNNVDVNIKNENPKENCTNFEWATVTPKEAPKESKGVVYRKPLQTKLTVKSNEPSGTDNSTKIIEDTNTDTNMVELGNIEIVTISYNSNSCKKPRKQNLKQRSCSDDLTFEELTIFNLETNKNRELKTPSPTRNLKDVYEFENIFSLKRKRKKLNSTSKDDEVKMENNCLIERMPKRGRNRSKDLQFVRESYSTRSTQRQLMKNSPSKMTSHDLSVSSDSDLDLPSPKSLKCRKCKKLFKTSRSLAIHKKRCTIVTEYESESEITMVEYLESEKEEETIETPSIESTKQDLDQIEIKTEDSSQVDELPQIVEIEAVPLRRSTRSQTLSNAKKNVKTINNVDNKKSRVTRSTATRNRRRKKEK